MGKKLNLIIKKIIMVFIVFIMGFNNVISSDVSALSFDSKVMEISCHENMKKEHESNKSESQMNHAEGHDCCDSDEIQDHCLEKEHDCSQCSDCSPYCGNVVYLAVSVSEIYPLDYGNNVLHLQDGKANKMTYFIERPPQNFPL